MIIALCQQGLCGVFHCLNQQTCLPAVSEVTLRHWFKDVTRQKEIKSLLAGHALPRPDVVASEPLPAAAERPKKDDPPSVQSVIDSSAAETNNNTEQYVILAEVQVPVSRTTQWRRGKSKATAGPMDGSSSEPTVQIPLAGHRPDMNKRKIYSCRVCGQPMVSEGHTQYRGKRFCPYAPGALSKEEWLHQQQQSAAAKKQLEQQASIGQTN